MKKSLFIALFIFTVSTSFAQTWIRCSNGLPVDTAVTSLIKFGNAIYAGTEHAGIYKSIDGGNNWTNSGFYDPIRKPIIKAFTVLDTFLFAAKTSNGLSRISINNPNWISVNNGIPKGSGNQLMFDIITVGDTLYAASEGGGVFTSTDRGDHWSVLYNNLGLNDRRVLSLAFNHQFLFAGTAGTNYAMPDTGVAFVTPRSHGTSWTVQNTGLTRNGAHLEAVTAMTANDTVAYLGTDDVGIHRSIDHGQSWKQIPGTELNGDIWSIEIVGTHVYDGTLYHGTFKSDDGGLTFYENNAGLNFGNISIPDLVDDLLVDEPYIYAATSTGVYKQLLDPTTGTAEISSNLGVSKIKVYPNPLTNETVFEIAIGHIGEKMTICITDIFGREIRRESAIIDENPTTLRMKRGEIESGVYFYSCAVNHEVIGSGKLMVQ